MAKRKVKRCRVQIPVTPETLVVLEAFAKAQSATVPAVTAELIQQTIPVVIEMTRALEMAKTAPARAMRHMTETMETAMVNVDQHLLDLTPRPKMKKRKTG